MENPESPTNCCLPANSLRNPSLRNPDPSSQLPNFTDSWLAAHLNFTHSSLVWPGHFWWVSLLRRVACSWKQWALVYHDNHKSHTALPALRWGCSFSFSVHWPYLCGPCSLAMAACKAPHSPLVTRLWTHLAIICYHIKVQHGHSFAERDIHRYSPNLTTQALWVVRNSTTWLQNMCNRNSLPGVKRKESHYATAYFGTCGKNSFVF